MPRRRLARLRCVAPRSWASTSRPFEGGWWPTRTSTVSSVVPLGGGGSGRCRERGGWWPAAAGGAWGCGGAGRPSGRAWGGRGARSGPGVTDVEGAAGSAGGNSRVVGACPADLYAARRGRSDPGLYGGSAGGARSEPYVGDFRAGVTVTRYFGQLELDEQMRPTGREIF